MGIQAPRNLARCARRLVAGFGRPQELDGLGPSYVDTPRKEVIQ
jgi:hypothetical protein